MSQKYHGRITIDSVEYGWNFRRVARAVSGELTGHSLYVFVPDGEGRDLILDFPYGELGSTEYTQDYSAIVAALRECVPLALGAGWDPARRGRPTRFDVSALRRVNQ